VALHDQSRDEPGSEDKESGEPESKAKEASDAKKDKESHDDDSGKKKDQSESDEKDDKGKDHHQNKKSESENDVEDAPLASLRLELRLATPIGKLKDKEDPLPDFIKQLRKELAEAANIPVERLDILDVRGGYADEEELSLLAKSIKSSVHDFPVLLEKRADGHSTIDIEVLPGAEPSDATPKDVYLVLKEQLAEKDSKLRQGKLKDVLKDAELTVQEGTEGLIPHDGAPQTRFTCFVLLVLLLSHWANEC